VFETIQQWFLGYCVTLFADPTFSHLLQFPLVTGRLRDGRTGTRRQRIGRWLSVVRQKPAVMSLKRGLARCFILMTVSSRQTSHKLPNHRILSEYHQSMSSSVTKWATAVELVWIFNCTTINQLFCFVQRSSSPEVASKKFDSISVRLLHCFAANTVSIGSSLTPTDYSRSFSVQGSNLF